MAMMHDILGPGVMAFTQFVEVAEGTKVTDFVTVLPRDWRHDVPVTQQYIDEHCLIEDVLTVLVMR